MDIHWMTPLKALWIIIVGEKSRGICCSRWVKYQHTFYRMFASLQTKTTKNQNRILNAVSFHYSNAIFGSLMASAYAYTWILIITRIILTKACLLKGLSAFLSIPASWCSDLFFGRWTYFPHICFQWKSSLPTTIFKHYLFH